ncbi:class I SAM-dependent methyltransferase [Bradyrhizobium sp. TZ2]
MSQITSGLYRLVGLPGFYQVLQSGLAGPNAHKNLVETIIRPKLGDRILDLGSGGSAVLEFMPDVDYVGVDANPRHIEAAQAKYGKRGRFVVGDAASVPDLGQDYDLVLMLGLLHHLSDEQARSALAIAAKVLKPEGRVFTLDPCWSKGQHWIARFLIGRDSGRMVRDETGYQHLARASFADVHSVVRHDLLRVPYTHCILDGLQPRKGQPA